MIEVEVSPTGVLFTGELPEESTAFIDADWVPDEGESRVEPLLWRPGELWRDEIAAEIPRDVPGTAAAITVLRSVAEEAVARTRGIPSRSIFVSGRGVTARMAEQALGLNRATKPGAHPHAWIDFTGDLAEIVKATARVADLGLVVLAGERSEDPGPINLYPDIHARSLRVIGVSPLLSRVPQRYGTGPTGPPIAARLGVRTKPGPWFEIRQA